MVAIKPITDLTPDQLREALAYDPDTGDLRWRISQGRGAAGRLIRCIDSSGYYTVMLNGRRMKAHRAAWALYFGVWSTKELDHINGDSLDNRIVNLREATRSQNSANTRLSPLNTSGFKGVYWQGRSRNHWTAAIKHNGKTISLGNYATPEEAHSAYMAKARELHGVFARDR